MRVKKLIIIISIMIASIFMILSPYFFPCLVTDGNSKLEASYQVAQIIMSIFAIFGVIVALWQYVVYSRRELDLKDKEIYDMDKARIQKAIDLAGYFKDNILDFYSPLNYILTQSKASKITDKIPYDQIIRFDVHEINQYLSKAEIQEIDSINKSKDFMDALIQISMCDERWKDCIKEIDVIEDGKSVKKVSVNNGSILFRYRQLLELTLNNLEFFAMHFIHETADESVVYQSLHNAYIEIVKQLYYHISINNNGSCEQKFYTNIILLYKYWRDEAIKQRKNDTAVADENIRTGNKLKK